MKYKLWFQTAILKKMLLGCLILSFSFAVASAQTSTITGKVLSKDGDTALADVSIKVKGSNVGTTTKADGSFSIQAPANGTLEVGYIGFFSQDVAINGSKNLTIRLVADVQSLQQVVVIGYGTQKKRDLTGAVSSISAATISKMPVTTVDQAL